MGFKHENGTEAIRFDPCGVSGAAAVDGYLLRFSVSYQVFAWSDKFEGRPRSFRNFHARAQLHPQGLHLGHPTAQRPLVLTPYAHAMPGTYMFELALPTSTIEKLEAIRAGGGLEIKLLLDGERDGSQNVVEHDDILFRISQSEWADVLEQMGYGVFLLCEIPIELGKDEALREAWRAMTRARKLMYSGHYSNVVLECRKALETTVAHFNLGDKIRSAAKHYFGGRDQRMAMSKNDRVLNQARSWCRQHLTPARLILAWRHQIPDISSLNKVKSSRAGKRVLL